MAQRINTLKQMYNFYPKKLARPPGRTLKNRLITKLNIFILTACGLQVSASACAQQITLTEKQSPLSQVFEKISRQTGYDFLVSTVNLKLAKPVTITIRNETLKAALDQIFNEQPLTYVIQDKMVVVSPKPPFRPSKAGAEVPVHVSGQISDSTGRVLPGATLKNKGTNLLSRSDRTGSFALDARAGDEIVVSFIGYRDYSFTASADQPVLKIVLKLSRSELQEVHVSTGYQTLSKERATGSFDQVDNQLINRSVSTNILNRLNGVTSGVLFNTSSAITAVSTNIDNNKTGITIRGTSTLNTSLVGGDPLIVLDNFRYQGDIRNINPNDVESVTILKDAAAASIWGARAGNGVIVITTKKGHINQQATITFNSSVSVANKPNVFYDRNFLDSKSFINAEQYLFKQGYFDSDLSNTSSRPVVSPAVEIMSRQRAGSLSAASANAQLDALGNQDVRNDFEKYIYQKAVNQQYSLGIRGGSPSLAYATAIGYDDNRDNLVRNGQRRITVSSTETYRPAKNLEVTGVINYSQSTVLQNNQLPFGALSSGGKYGMNPYTLLADGNGNPLAIVKEFRSGYIDSIQRLGFVDQHYRPLSDLTGADNTATITNLLLRASATYHFLPAFNAQVTYQNTHQQTTTDNDQGQQSYYTSSLINQFSQYNPATKTFTYPFPLGSIRTLGNYNLNDDNLRTQLNFNKDFGQKHTVTALAGAEVNQSVNKGNLTSLYGYNDAFGTSVSNLNYNTSYPANPSGSATITAPGGGVTEQTYRYLSYFANGAYTYDQRYTVTLSGRKDGANIFGAKTNDKITPLWSAGLGWNVSNEKFYHADWLPYLKIRTTYGYSGNVYNGSAYSTGVYGTSSLTGAAYINGLTPPNPDLRWEKVKITNLGIDFAAKNHVIQGTIEAYQKNGTDLIETVPLSASTGFVSFNGNAAATRTRGIDLTLSSKNLKGAFTWSTTLLYSYLHDEVLKYDVTQTATSIQTLYGTAIAGKPIFSIFSYKWAGLDPSNGDPQGYLNGKISKNYTGIISNFSPDSLKFNGSARPTSFGSLRNDFSYRRFSLSVNIKYELGWYFRRPSVSGNYTDLLASPNSDYTLRWQQPGDEQHTNVPSMIYPSNTNRATFYQFSDVLVQNGGNIRLQDIRLSYDFDLKNRASGLARLQIYSYASNLGILWRANHYGLDPDAIPTSSGGHLLTNPFTIAFGIQASF